MKIGLLGKGYLPPQSSLQARTLKTQSNPRLRGRSVLFQLLSHFPQQALGVPCIPYPASAH